MSSTPLALVPDLYQRRDALFRVHSLLRSIDNLRPDEALDELVLLYRAWIEAGGVAVHEVRRAEPELSLSDPALEAAVDRLWPLFAVTSRGGGGDLFQELVDVGVRSGMGQYFTPQPVAEAMAEFLAPQAGEAWLDPFCGSGRLLGEIAARVPEQIRLHGIDRDPRLIRLAQLESRLHHPRAPTALIHTNGLGPVKDLLRRLGASPDGVDGVVTNPPFGAEVHEHDRSSYASFDLARLRNGTPLEILGLEQSVRMLRPGGRLGIVVPQSVLSNRRDRNVREWVMTECEIDGVLSLPGETFAPFQGVGKAAVLFVTRRSSRGSQSRTRMGIARSVGYDSTGRGSGEPDVVEIALAMRSSRPGPQVAVLEAEAELARNLTAEWHLRHVAEGRPLGELVRAIFCGRTPARSAYLSSEEVASRDHETLYRVLKVGDLTGTGIDWSIGERSCVQADRATKLLEVGDIVTTAAAHHPRYIGAKVDIADVLPPLFGTRVFPCAEIMVVRPDPTEVDPYALLLWLRSDEGREALQACVTGQTAHLHAEDVRDVVVPDRVLAAEVSEARRALEESLRLRRLAEAGAKTAERLFRLSLEEDRVT